MFGVRRFLIAWCAESEVNSHSLWTLCMLGLIDAFMREAGYDREFGDARDDAIETYWGMGLVYP